MFLCVLLLMDWRFNKRFEWFFSAPEIDRLDTYLMALSAIQNGYKLNIIGPKRQDYFDTIGSMDRLWAFKDFGTQISHTLSSPARISL